VRDKIRTKAAKETPMVNAQHGDDRQGEKKVLENKINGAKISESGLKSEGMGKKITCNGTIS
jgi:hypothetical protein